MTTHGMRNSSGVFLNENSLGKTLDMRIDRGTLPPVNSAEFETKMELAKDQNLVYGKITGQPKWEKTDQKPRTGGAEQVIGWRIQIHNSAE